MVVWAEVVALEDAAAPSFELDYASPAVQVAMKEWLFPTGLLRSTTMLLRTKPRKVRHSMTAAKAIAAEAIAAEAIAAGAAEGLTLLRADSASGFLHVSAKGGRYRARLDRGGKYVGLGSYPTPEKAALGVARRLSENLPSNAPVGRRLRDTRPADATPRVLTAAGAEAVAAAAADGLTLVRANNATAFCTCPTGRPRARTRRSSDATATTTTSAASARPKRRLCASHDGCATTRHRMGRRR